MSSNAASVTTVRLPAVQTEERTQALKGSSPLYPGSRISTEPPRNRSGFGLDLHVDDHQRDSPSTSGRHAATSWTAGAPIHFALHESKTGGVRPRADVALRVTDLLAAREAVSLESKYCTDEAATLGERLAIDSDGNIVELTQLL